MKINPILLTDGYKTSHHKMYPEGTTEVYSNYTCRSVSRMHKHAKDILVVGTKYLVINLHEIWVNNFFSVDKATVIGEAKKYLDSYLGYDYDMSHFEALHDLGYLPIEIKTLKEGTIVSEKIPVLTIKNTHPDFYWLTNFLETYISTTLWKSIHSGSVALAFRKILNKWARNTDAENIDFVDFQAHDFSFRGMQGLDGAIASGLAFAMVFSGSDTIPVLQAADYYYFASEGSVYSVPASEHAVMTAYGKEDEIEGFRRLMQQYPKGILSVVSDSFDLWKVCTEYLPELKEEILARDGKLVIRPDSGDPVDIICGINTRNDPDNRYVNLVGTPEQKGVIELLWDTFGGTVNEQGYKVLDPHIGCIYGDGITLDRAEEICARLASKGFASTNIVLGIGSYSLGLATRDNQGGAVKATHVVVNGINREIFKDPITDDGTKKSARGYLAVHKNLENTYVLKDRVSAAEEKEGFLRAIYKDGCFTGLPDFSQKLQDIREYIKNNI